LKELLKRKELLKLLISLVYGIFGTGESYLSCSIYGGSSCLELMWGIGFSVIS